MQLLLTGAGGFVGRALLAKFAQRGYFIKALARRSSPMLAKADEIIIETLSPHSDFAALLADCDAVIHLADGFNQYENIPRVKRDIEDAEQRLATTIALADEAARQGVRFIYLSTIKTMCGTSANEVLDETTTPQPRSLYGQLKLEAEQAILSTAKQQGSQAVVLRFPIVFGRGVGGNMEKLLALANTPLPLPFEGLEARRSLISSDSLIDAVCTIVECTDAGAGVFLVHDEAISTGRLIEQLRHGLGRPGRLFALPAAVWPILSNLPGPGAVLGPKLQRFTHSLIVDDARFRKAYGWQPEKSLDELLQDFARPPKSNG